MGGWAGGRAHSSRVLVCQSLGGSKVGVATGAVAPRVPCFPSLEFSFGGHLHPWFSYHIYAVVTVSQRVSLRADKERVGDGDNMIKSLLTFT